MTYGGVPRWVAVVAAVGALFVLLPLVAMVTRVNWAEFVPLVTSESSVSALWLSLRTSLAATALCIVLGVPIAIVLVRLEEGPVIMSNLFDYEPADLAIDARVEMTYEDVNDEVTLPVFVPAPA